MRQVVNRADAKHQASVERSPSGQTPHPRPAVHSSQSDAGDTDARSRGIKFPISNQPLSRMRDYGPERKISIPPVLPVIRPRVSTDNTRERTKKEIR